LVFNPAAKTFIKAMFGQGFREPTVFESGAHKSNHVASELKPVKLNAYELSFSQMLGDYTNFLNNCVSK